MLFAVYVENTYRIMVIVQNQFKKVDVATNAIKRL